MNVVDCIQGDQVWFQCHAGAVTASRVSDVVKKRQKGTGPLKGYLDLVDELVSERIKGAVDDNFVSRWMQDGIDKEPLARTEYEIRIGISVEQVGFVYHPTIKDAGCSPDGLIGDDGLLEIKCPKSSTHIAYLRSNKIPDDYLPQMLWQLACCPDRQWNDFVSFDPSQPEDWQFFCKRLPRNEEAEKVIRGMELEVAFFLEEVDKQLREARESRLRSIAEYKMVTA